MPFLTLHRFSFPLLAALVTGNVYSVSHSQQGSVTPLSQRVVEERLAFYHVPGVSVAVIDGGKVAWARGYGVPSAGNSAKVDAETLFQVASISKAVTATAALKLVQEGRLSLDAPVNTVLQTWKLPAARPTWATSVTLRRLLSHTAGINVPGYLGYAVGKPVPTLPEVLRGENPATSPPVMVERTPGTTYLYSGGGYEVVQLLMEEKSGQGFNELMGQELLRPLHMAHSTFAQPLPETLAPHAARAHTVTGQPLVGRWHTYPELAAAGLWSTPTDLANWLLALSKSANAEQDAYLNSTIMGQMLTDYTPGLARWFSGHAYGLGLKLQGQGKAFSFSHTGINQGYRALAIMYPLTGQGVVIMTNGENGEALIQELLRSLAEVYHWPNQHSRWKTWMWPLLAVMAFMVLSHQRRVRTPKK